MLTTGVSCALGAAVYLDSSPLKPFLQMNRNLVGSIYGMSSMKNAHFVRIGQQTWPPHAIFVSDWSISKKSSPLKLLSHMNQHLVGSSYMYGRFCIKFPQSRMEGERHRLSPLSLQFVHSFLAVKIIVSSIIWHNHSLKIPNGTILKKSDFRSFKQKDKHG